ncbi:hypothetical protein BHE74_00051177 [Ensete ventricosum]|nr:hypothetical protein GW17_00022088 [Ensete ventricosum]RWW43186.1 hypothetical protein BHE74_00051177 [Ensete ventricosum]RZR76249.1 hypothetical protein BHM03_00000914 [Ensete ventricosum]
MCSCCSLQHGQEPLGGADLQRHHIRAVQLRRRGGRRHHRVVRHGAAVQQRPGDRAGAAPQGGTDILLLGELRRRAVPARAALQDQRDVRAGPAGEPEEPVGGLGTCQPARRRRRHVCARQLRPSQ